MKFYIMVDIIEGFEVIFLFFYIEVILNVNRYLCSRMVRCITGDVFVIRSCGIV